MLATRTHGPVLGYFPDLNTTTGGPNGGLSFVLGDIPFGEGFCIC
jgi:hypothetical protein